MAQDESEEKEGFITFKRILAIALAILFLSFSVYIFIAYVTGYNNGSAFYIAEIHAPEDTEYTLLLPLPLKNNGEIAKIVDFIHVKEGGGDVLVVNSDHGIALKVTGKGDMKIEGWKKWDTTISSHSPDADIYIIGNMSMLADMNRSFGYEIKGHAWIWSNITADIEINIWTHWGDISAHAGWSPGGKSYDVEIEISSVNRGWNLGNVTARDVAYG